MDDYIDDCLNDDDEIILCCDDDDISMTSKNIFLETYLNHGPIGLSQLLLTADPSINQDEALGLASENGDLQMVRILINDPRVNPGNNDNYALRNAIHVGNLGVVNELLTVPTVDPTKGIEIAHDLGLTELLEILLLDARSDPYIVWKYRGRNLDQLPATSEVLRSAIEENDTEAAKQLLARDDVIPDDSMLIVAIQKENNKLVELLLARNEISPSCNENLAVTMAQDLGFPQILRLLLESERLSTIGLSQSQYAIHRRRWVYLEVFRSDDMLREILSYTREHVMATKRIERISHENLTWKRRYLRTFPKMNKHCKLFGVSDDEIEHMDYRSAFYKQIRELSLPIIEELTTHVERMDLQKAQAALLKIELDSTPTIINFSLLVEIALNGQSVDILLELLCHRHCRLGFVKYRGREIVFGDAMILPDNSVKYLSNGIWERSPDQVNQIFELAIRQSDKEISTMIIDHYCEFIQDANLIVEYGLLVGQWEYVENYLSSSSVFPPNLSNLLYDRALKTGNFEFINGLLEDSRFCIQGVSELLNEAMKISNQKAISFLTRCLDLGRHEPEKEIVPVKNCNWCTSADHLSEECPELKQQVKTKGNEVFNCPCAYGPPVRWCQYHGTSADDGKCECGSGLTKKLCYVCKPTLAPVKNCHWCTSTDHLSKECPELKIRLNKYGCPCGSGTPIHWCKCGSGKDDVPVRENEFRNMTVCRFCKSIFHSMALCKDPYLSYTPAIDLSEENTIIQEIFQLPKTQQLQALDRMDPWIIPLNSSKVINRILFYQRSDPALTIEVLRIFLTRGIGKVVTSEIFQEVILKKAYMEFKLILEVSAEANQLIVHNQLLVEAVILGLSPLVEILLPYVDPMFSDCQALTDACDQKHVEIVRILLSDPRVVPSSAHLTATLQTDRGSGNMERIVTMLLRDPRVIPNYVHYKMCGSTNILKCPRLELEGFNLDRKAAMIYYSPMTTLERIDLMTLHQLNRAFFRLGDTTDRSHQTLTSIRVCLMREMSLAGRLEDLSEKIFQSSSFLMLYELSIDQLKEYPLIYDHPLITRLGRVLLIASSSVKLQNNIFEQYAEKILPLFIASENGIKIHV
ncbi:Hypothetical protein POVR1_LOCUS18 [uncultured virus]|nr:Hypothetical protein POVR1_LOCUS18 [uncultured virus]